MVAALYPTPNPDARTDVGNRSVMYAVSTAHTGVTHRLMPVTSAITSRELWYPDRTSTKYKHGPAVHAPSPNTDRIVRRQSFCPRTPTRINTAVSIMFATICAFV